ncbi:cytochrome P450 [Nocardia sp. GAS34]|uniref:cytochrome P450 n=1 Tax=unclassified Nocardia TaxID=2637762 RepID=UPI003D1E98C6
MPSLPDADPASFRFVIPEICLPFPDVPVREDAGALCDRTIKWGLRFGLIGRRGAARLRSTSMLDLGVALSGSAPAARAQVLMDWVLWGLVLDDRIDDGPWAEGGALERFAAFVEQILTANRTATELRDPMLVVLAEDLWPRSRALGGRVWQQQLGRHLVQHLEAQCELVGRRHTCERFGEDDYIRVRRETFGAYYFFDLIDGIDGVADADRRCDTGCENTLREHAADVVSWTNDLYSVVKDVVCGEQYNLVTVLSDTRGLELQDAVDAAHAMLMDVVADYLTVAQRHTDHSTTEPVPGVDSATRLQQVMQASAHWHRSVSRYHLQADAPAVARRQVDTRGTPPTLKSRQFEVDPEPLYERLRSELPVAYDEPTDTWLVSRHVDVKMALTDPRFSNDNYTWQIGPLLGHCIVSMEGHEHAAHRALLTPEFRGRALEVLQSSITDVASGLVDRLAECDRVDLVAEFTSALPIRVMARALGLPAETSEQVRRLKSWASVGFAYLGNYRQDPSLLTGGLDNRDDFYNYLQPHLDARRASPGNDLISALLAATIDGEPLSEDAIRATCAILITAGSETSHGALANFIVNVLDEPGVKAAVMNDPALLDNAFAETLRRNPPLQLVLRQTREVVDLPSGTVPANATVACLIGAANRDPDRFERPDEFDLHRVDRLDREYSAAASHYAFGAGRHYCLGSHLARAEITTGMSLLLNAYPNIGWASGFRPVTTGFLNRCPARLEVTL